MERCVIGGCPGSGKSSLIESLRSFPSTWVSQESATALKSSAEGQLIWQNMTDQNQDPAVKKKARLEFEKLVLRRDIDMFISAPSNVEYCFFDCGIIESIAHLKLDGIEAPSDFVAARKKFRYDYVFLAPFWPGLLRESSNPTVVEWVRKISETIRDAYVDSGYETIELPRVSVEERTRFVLERLGKSI